MCLNLLYLVHFSTVLRYQNYSKILLLSDTITRLLCVSVLPVTFLQPLHLPVFLSVSLVPERAALVRDPGKASWRTCMKTSRPPNVPLVHTSQWDAYRFSSDPPNLLVLCINMKLACLTLHFCSLLEWRELFIRLERSQLRLAGQWAQEPLGR